MVKKEQHSICLAAVGDLALGDHPARVGSGVGTALTQQGTAYIFQKMSLFFRHYDCVFGNLEYAFRSSPKVLDLLDSQCISNPLMAKVLGDIGFNVLNIANNHIFQFGGDVFSKTIERLKKNNITPIGIAGNSSGASVPAIIESNKIKTGWLGYSLRPRQHFTEQPPYAEGIPDKILDDIKVLKSEVDHVIISIHWGDEFIEKPSPDEISLAHAMVDCGASVVLGHHPHVLRGVEIYKGGLIAYSLGNFVCDMVWEDRLQESMVLEVELNMSEIVGYNIRPIHINETFQPDLVSGEQEKDRYFKRQNKRDAYVRDTLNLYTQNIYKKEALLALQLNRKASHQYFFKHLKQYPLKIISQQVIESIRARFRDGFYW